MQHGAYDWRKIYFTKKEGFQYISYDLGVVCSLLSPSCTYNFLIDPEKERDFQSLSVAHKIDSRDFDRVFLVVGATKSGFFKIQFTFITSKMRELKSQVINLQIWNPRNTYFSLRGGKDSNIITSEKNLIERNSPYNIEGLKKGKNKSWGY